MKRRDFKFNSTNKKNLIKLQITFSFHLKTLTSVLIFIFNGKITGINTFLLWKRMQNFIVLIKCYLFFSNLSFNFFTYFWIPFLLVNLIRSKLVYYPIGYLYFNSCSMAINAFMDPFILILNSICILICVRLLVVIHRNRIANILVTCSLWCSSIELLKRLDVISLILVFQWLVFQEFL